MAWGAGGGGAGGVSGGGGAAERGRALLPRSGGVVGVGASSSSSLAPGLPPRVSTQATVVLIVLGFLLGRFTTSTTTATTEAAAAGEPPPAAAALPLPTLPAGIRALRGAEERHAALAAAVERGDIDATPYLPDMGPLGRAWLRESGLLALRPPVEPAPSGSRDYVLFPYQILSWHPRIVVFPAFLDAPRRERVIALADARLEQSSLAWRPNERADPNQRTRTSKGAFLSRRDDPSGVLAQIEERIAAVTLLPVSHGEAFNILRYDEGAHYASHMDTFGDEFGPQTSNRMATMLIYLTDVEAGGETIFKREGAHGEARPITDWADCKEGFKYKPRAGDAVLFYSLTPAGKIDPRALHGGCPVVGGKPKLVMTRWIHDRPIGGVMEATGLLDGAARR